MEKENYIYIMIKIYVTKNPHNSICIVFARTNTNTRIYLKHSMIAQRVKTEEGNCRQNGVNDFFK